MRHLPFVIGRPERDAWYQAMRASVLEGDLTVEDEADMLDYFDKSATFMVNQHDGTGPKLGLIPPS